MNFSSYSDDEVKKWLYLRAIEWCGFPQFIAQPIAPILFIFLPWYQVLIGVFVLANLWGLIRNSFVSPAVSTFACLFVGFLKWPASLAAMIYFLIHHRVWEAAMSITYPFWGGIIPCLIPARIGFVEIQLARKTGFVTEEWLQQKMNSFRQKTP